MSEILKCLKQLEELNVNQLADALEFNGYAECVGAIRTKSIDGEQFLKLTEVQISLWRLPSSQTRRLWSFVQQIRQDPTQFLLNSQATTKMAPNVKAFNKPSISRTVPTKSNTSLDKPGVPVKPTPTNATTKVNETNSSTLTKSENKLLKNKLEQVLNVKDSEEMPNNSFIYNQRQPRLPPKPEHLKLTNIQDTNDQIEETSDEYSDGYLSPIKFDTTPNKNAYEIENAPPVAISRSNSTSSTNSFLSIYRKSYTNLERRPKVIENNYEEQNNKSSKISARDRPLPPIPIQTIGSKHDSDIEFDTDDEELSEYTSVLDDGEIPEYTPIPDDIEEFNNLNKEANGTITQTQITNQLKNKASFSRPLPPPPIKTVSSTNQLINRKQKYKSNSEVENSSNVEQLSEYTSIPDEEDFSDVHSKTQLNVQEKKSPFHRHLSPTPPKLLDSINQSFRNKPKPTTQIAASNEDNPPTETQKLRDNKARVISSISVVEATPIKSLKPRAELPNSRLPPKSSNNLPKPPNLPPSDLLSPPDFLLTSNDELTFVTDPRHRPLPPLPPSEVTDEFVNSNETDVTEEAIHYYSQVDITTDPCYRATDRKGARLLLTGLEDGAFVIRPSRQDKYICTFSIMHMSEMFNVGVEKTVKGNFQFGSVTPDFNQPVFHCVEDIISYYSRHPLHLSGEAIILKSILPSNRR